MTTANASHFLLVPLRYRRRFIVSFTAAGMAAVIPCTHAASPPVPATESSTPATQSAWQAAYDRAQAGYVTGDLRAAEQAARAALAQARAGRGENRPFVASSMNLLALVRQRQGHAKEAADLLREALAASEQMPGGEAQAAALALNLGNVLDALDSSDEALAAYRRSLDAADRLGPDAPARAQALAALARMHTLRNETEQASRYNAQLLAMRQPLAPAEQAQALLRKARLLQTRNEPDAAVQALRDALALEGRPAELETLSALATLYSQLGRDDDAAPLHLRATALLEQSDPTGKALAGHLNELGLWLLQRRELDQAQALLERASAIMQARDPDGMETARIVANLAQVFEAQHELEPAETLYRRALAIYESHGDAPDALLGQAHALNFLAGQDYRRRRFAQAESQFLRALALTEQVAGPQSTGLLPLLDNLVALYRSQQRPRQAEPYAERAEDLRKAQQKAQPSS